MSTAKAKGWPVDRLHSVYFIGAMADTSDDDSFEIRISSSGASLTVYARPYIKS